MSMSENKRTPLYEEHVKLNAKIIDFHGWDMPLQYTKIMDEHMAVRKHAGIFDVSHMGDVVVHGKDAEKFLDHMFPTKISDLENGHAVYTAFLNENGNIIDDTIVYRISNDKFFFVPNASMIDTIVSWVKKNSSGYSVNISDYSSDIACIALQGPDSIKVMASLGIKDPGSFRFEEMDSGKLKFSENKITGRKSAIISGTGYTGEHGIEILCSSKDAASVWETVLKEVKAVGGLPCGLGARDTLRMEKGMLLSGTDFHGDRNPHECAITFILTNDGEFIGKEGLSNPVREVFRGFITDSKIIPRAGNAVMSGENHVGNITSGTLSPVLDRAIALGFIDRKFAKPGSSVMIKVRDRDLNAMVSRPKMVP